MNLVREPGVFTVKIHSILRVAPLMVLALAAGCTDPTADKTAARMSDPSAPAPAAPAPAATPDAEAPALAAAATVFAFNGDTSSIGFEGYKVTGAHTGGFAKFDGKVTVPGGDLNKAQLELGIDMLATFSDDPGLTKKLLSADFFDVEKFPTATFTSTSIVEAGIMYDVTGNLTLHGVTKGITFPAEIKIDGGALTATAEFTINRMEWGVVYPGMADDAIRENVLLTFDVKAKSAS